MRQTTEITYSNWLDFLMTRRLPPLRSLRAFEAAGRHLSFVRAADELGVTPAAISQQIKLLEEWVGQPLFNRDHTLSLTQSAQVVFPLLGESFDKLEQACGQLKISQNNKCMVVSTPHAFAARWLLPRLDRFQAKHPNVEVRLSATARLVDFATEDVDLAIRYGPGTYPGLFSERLKVEEAVAVSSPKLAGQIKSPADLLTVTLLRNDAMFWDPSFPDWASWLKSANLDPALATIRSYGEEASLVIQAAIEGLGVALICRTLVADELERGRLSIVMPGWELSNAYHFVCPQRNLNLASVTAFRDWIKTEMESPYA